MKQYFCWQGTLLGEIPSQISSVRGDCPSLLPTLAMLLLHLAWWLECQRVNCNNLSLEGCLKNRLPHQGRETGAKSDRNMGSVLTNQGIELQCLHNSPTHCMVLQDIGSEGTETAPEWSWDWKVGPKSIQQTALETINITHRFESTQERSSQPTTQLCQELAWV